MDHHLSVGKKLVENFELLLLYMPDENCARVVNENMCNTPEFSSFRRIILYLLKILDRKFDITNYILPQDDRELYITAQKYLHDLSMEFSDLSLPNLFASHLKCFYGDKARQSLLKFTFAVLQHIMNKEGLPDVNGDTCDEDMIMKQNNDLRKELMLLSDDTKHSLDAIYNSLGIILEANSWTNVEILPCPDTEPWNGITGLKETLTAEKTKLKKMKKDLYPYLEHVFHHDTECCACALQVKQASCSRENIIENIYSSFEDILKAHIHNIETAASVRKVMLMKDTNQKIPEELKVYEELMGKLKKFVDIQNYVSSLENISLIDSPLNVNRTTTQQIFNIQTPKAFKELPNTFKKGLIVCEPDIINFMDTKVTSTSGASTIRVAQSPKKTMKAIINSIMSNEMNVRAAMKEWFKSSAEKQRTVMCSSYSWMTPLMEENGNGNEQLIGYFRKSKSNDHRKLIMKHNVIGASLHKDNRRTLHEKNTENEEDKILDMLVHDVLMEEDNNNDDENIMKEEYDTPVSCRKSESSPYLYMFSSPSFGNISTSSNSDSNSLLDVSFLMKEIEDN